MAESPNASIENLRKRSRTLLARVEENSRRLNNEFKRFRGRSTLPETNYQVCDNNLNFSPIKLNYPWAVRNNSRGVSGVLCPDYFFSSPSCTSRSVPEMPQPGRILIRSCKAKCDLPPRKPTKGCYCRLDVTEKKQPRSARTCHKPMSPCDYCRSHFDILTSLRREDNEAEPLAAPLSCETLRKIREIDYEPKSQFLRNMQSKVSFMQNGSSGDYAHPCKQHDPQTLMKDKLLRDKNSESHCTAYRTESYCTTCRTESSRPVENSRTVKSSRISRSDSFVEEDKYPRKEVICKADKQAPVNTQKSPKVIRKMVSSKKRIIKSNEDEKARPANPRCPIFRVPRRVLEKPIDNECHCPEHCSKVGCCGIRDRGRGKMEKLSDREIQRLRTFRDENYFDTHGSSQTLISSRSSGSLEQFTINDRLFPQPLRRINKEDLVVTVPPCMTKQRRKLHYFPKTIVRQEKGTHNTNVKRRFHGCPLIGHSVDLGILKTRLPLNSLALKYQKRSSY